jgi:hypothetical protein
VPPLPDEPLLDPPRSLEPEDPLGLPVLLPELAPCFALPELPVALEPVPEVCEPFFLWCRFFAVVEPVVDSSVDELPLPDIEPDEPVLP